MRMRDQMAMGDGFDKNVAVKMPKIKKEEEPLASDLVEDSEAEARRPPEAEVSGREREEKTVGSPPRSEKEREAGRDVLRLVEDLHRQLLAASQTKRALEIDLSSSRKTIHQLIQDNKQLRSDLEALRKEVEASRELQRESVYLKEENEDALERIRQYQEEFKALKENLSQIAQERDEALRRSRELESQIEQIEVLRIKEKLKEREAVHFAEENRDLRSRLEEALARNMELQSKYEEIRKSFAEVRESLMLLRDSCKASYYNLSEEPPYPSSSKGDRF